MIHDTDGFKSTGLTRASSAETCSSCDLYVLKTEKSRLIERARSSVSRVDFGPYSDLAYRWAPIHYQYVNLASPRVDLLCAVNFDGDWDTSNSRENMGKFDLVPVIYYATAETKTHYFLLFACYHADDRGLSDHENDLEGCLLIIERGDVEKEEERLLGMITVGHQDFWAYVYKSRLRAGEIMVRGKIYMERFQGIEHPMTRQISGKHGFYPWRGAPWYAFWEKHPWYAFWNGRDSQKQVGVRYVPANEAKMPAIEEIKSFSKTEANYVLIDVAGDEGFWKRRDDPLTFRDHSFNASTSRSANPPWEWDDKDDRFPAGTLFNDPAKIANKYFRGYKNFSYDYTKRMEERR